MSSEQEKIDGSSWDGSLSRAQFYLSASAFAERWNKFNSALPQCSWVPRPTLPWLAATTCQAEGYLSVDNVILPCIAGESHECNDEGVEEDLSCSDENGLTDDATLALNHTQERCHYDFHIVYSTSYRVPVLYFRASYNDGQLLALDDIQKNIPVNSAKALMESEWTFITQEAVFAPCSQNFNLAALVWKRIAAAEFDEENAAKNLELAAANVDQESLKDHPYLNRPWYTLHPCGTREWMKMLFLNEHMEAVDGDRITKYLVSWFSVVGQVVGLRIPFEMLGNSG